MNMTALARTPRLWGLLFVAMIALTAAPCLAAQAPVRVAASAEANPKADTGTGKQLEAKSAIKADATPVAVELEGTDTLGAKLSFQLKEVFNSGTLFALNDKDTPKLVVFISTTSEFPSRPEVGSAYSVVWVYSERSSVLSNYLAHEVGVVTPEGVADLAARLAERTSGLAAKHSYIFSK